VKSLREIKTWNSALGAEKHCPNFDPCPLCFGCRNYTEKAVRCDKCAEDNYKKNICNTERHTEKALGMMIRQTELKLYEA
jgi:hypothetical protein